MPSYVNICNAVWSASLTLMACWQLPSAMHIFNSNTHMHLTALFPGLHGWAGTRKITPIWIFVKQEIVSGSGISWAICMSAPCSRLITTLAPHYSVFYRPDALPTAQPTVSKHWRQDIFNSNNKRICIAPKKEASQRIGNQVWYCQSTKVKATLWSVDLTEGSNCWNMLWKS